MSYAKQGFVSGQVLTADHLNNIESGIYNLSSDIDGINNSILQINKEMTEKSAAIIEQVGGETISLDNCAECSLIDFKIYGKTVSDNSQTPDKPIDLVNIGESGNINVTIGVSETDEAPQTLMMSTPTGEFNGLSGIPSIKNGKYTDFNYTDLDGKQYIADYRDWVRGVDVKMVGKYVVTGDDITSHDGNAVRVSVDKSIVNYIHGRYIPMVCNKFRKTEASLGSTESAEKNLSNGNFTHYYYDVNENTKGFYFRSSYFTDVDVARAWFKANEVVVLYPLANPIVTPIPEDELAAYAASHVNYQNTVISNDSLAHMEARYVVDLKLYIDSKFAELA